MISIKGYISSTLKVARKFYQLLNRIWKRKTLTNVSWKSHNFTKIQASLTLLQKDLISIWIPRWTSSASWPKDFHITEVAVTPAKPWAAASSLLTKACNSWNPPIQKLTYLKNKEKAMCRKKEFHFRILEIQLFQLGVILRICRNWEWPIKE